MVTLLEIVLNCEEMKLLIQYGMDDLPRLVLVEAMKNEAEPNRGQGTIFEWFNVELVVAFCDQPVVDSFAIEKLV